ncbi:unnamed protein product, partial [Symbiodinium pilosum]
MGQVATAICGKLLGSSAFCQSKCRNINCCTSSAELKVYDPFSRPPWMQQPPVYDPRWPRQQPRAPTDGSDTELPSERFACKKLKLMTSIWVDSRKRAAGTDADFEFDVGQTVHLQGSARLSVFKIRVADTFLSTDRGTYMYWRAQALETLNWAQLPVGAYTGATNEITVSHDVSEMRELLSLRKQLTHEAYRQAWMEGIPGEAVISYRFESRNHVVNLVCVQKVGLSPFTDKVYQLDRHNSRPHGHWRNLIFEVISFLAPGGYLVLEQRGEIAVG